MTGRRLGARWLLRIEDLDPTRTRASHVAGIDADLAWLGLVPDGPRLVQSQRTAHYRAALEQLIGEGLAYACFCTRADLARSLTAPHGDPGAHYPGICRALPDDPARRAAEPHCWRLDHAKAVARVGRGGWREADGRAFDSTPADLGDAVLARKDAPAAYHLACVVDDAESGVDCVVRGADLRPSTPIQRLLQALLGLPEPVYCHHPLVTFADGRRLAKRDFAPTLAALRDDGIDGRRLAADLAEGDLPPGFAFSDDG